MTVRVVVVDDQALISGGFAMLIQAQDNLSVVGKAGDGAEALRLLSRVRADVVVMDIRMPGMDGVTAKRIFCESADSPEVLVLNTFRHQ
ncbi:hypothetical protein GCM10022223_33090 [Kineosporia mesophila]|uniref:Response regulatory domain-containing protein n=1 Tax=Kineosporia mesophila TaxID=566012 RepID=A0ABP6ZNF8_9ACTN|nr:response regulator transcription factor [Kineosporia mesophila]